MKTKQVHAIRKTLAKIGLLLARSLNPRMLPAVNWSDTVAVEWPTDDGRVIYADLSRVSHIVSDPALDGVENARPADPRDRGCTIHMTNGDMHRLAYTYAEATGRLSMMRGNIMDQLNQAFGVPNDS